MVVHNWDMIVIKRIFKVTIKPALREAFENDFKEISYQVVTNCEGLISIEIGKPTQWNPDEYLMISNWVDESSLEKFAGIDWNKASIPAAMKKYALAYSVDHFICEEAYS